MMSEMPQADRMPTQLIPREGWVVMHLFYHIEHAFWQRELTADEQREAKTDLTRVIQEIRSLPKTQLMVFSMVSPKADIGFMVLTEDLAQANQIEKQLAVALGPEVLTPSFSYLSMTESSEYTTTEEQYREQLVQEKQLARGSSEHEEAVVEFNERMTKYLQHRLYPNLPDWPIFCFYPMGKRRLGNDNWYSLTFEDRKKLMSSHATIGRRWSGKILQLITGSTGLDDSEWGVSLFAHDLIDVKEIVYQMRFDEVSARFGEFGEFYIGLQLPLDEVFSKLQL